MPDVARSIAASIGAHESWARTADRAARTAPARAASLARFERQADPDGNLPPGERQRRAESLLQAHMARMRLASAKARAERKSARAREAADELRALADLIESSAGAQ